MSRLLHKPGGASYPPAFTASAALATDASEAVSTWRTSTSRPERWVYNRAKDMQMSTCAERERERQRKMYTCP